MNKYSTHHPILPPKNEEIEEVEIPKAPKTPPLTDLTNEPDLEKLLEKYIIYQEDPQKKKEEQRKKETVILSKHKKEAEILDLCELFNTLTNNDIS